MPMMPLAELIDVYARRFGLDEAAMEAAMALTPSRVPAFATPLQEFVLDCIAVSRTMRSASLIDVERQTAALYRDDGRRVPWHDDAAVFGPLAAYLEAASRAGEDLVAKAILEIFAREHGAEFRAKYDIPFERAGKAAREAVLGAVRRDLDAAGLRPGTPLTEADIASAMRDPKTSMWLELSRVKNIFLEGGTPDG